MKKIVKLLILFLLLSCKTVNASDITTKVEEVTTTPSITYSTHVQTYGWQDNKKDGELSGTVGEYKRLEGIKINLDSSIEGGVEYQTFVQTYAWQGWKKDGEMAGTTGEYKRLEAIKIRLTGEIATKYDIYYRVHSQTYGWLGWAKNGETAGTINEYKRLEAIEIKLVLKDTGDATGNSYVGPATEISYQSHVQDIGWQGLVSNGAMSGTTGQGKRIEAMVISVNNNQYTGSLKYQSYIEGIGWQGEKNAGEVTGTTGKSKMLEAIKITLTDELALKYDIYYRVHSQAYGWLGWAKNGEMAGTIGYDFRLEAIEIKLVLKDTGEATGNSYQEKETSLTYQAHVQSIGDQEAVTEGEISGTTGLGKRLEAFKINLTTTLSGNVIYKSYGSDDKWSEYITDNSYTGTTGQSKPIYLIAIDLTDELKEKYDIYYRVHSERYGWLDWAKNGEETGADYYDIQAIEVKLYLKIDSRKNSLANTNYHITTGFYQENGNIHYKDKDGNAANDWINIMNTKYFFNSLGVMIGKNVKKVIDVSNWQKDVDWDTIARERDVDGVILRIGAGCEEDLSFAKNIEAIKRLNIPYGIYLYSYAETLEDGKEYANFTLSMIKKYSLNPRIGIFYDLESNNITSYMQLSNYTQVVDGYMQVMNSAGYGSITKLYTYKSMADNQLNSPYLRDKIAWIAQYNHYCTYTGSYIGWQYSSQEKVKGITGNVDASVWFVDF